MRNRNAATVLLPLLLAVALASAGGAQQESTKDNAFTWSGSVPAGQWIRIHDVSGSITFDVASGDKVEVVATERWRRGDPSVVHFDMQKSGSDVTICALWGSRSHCAESGGDDAGDNVKNNDVSVDFKVLVPRGVKIGGASVNGAIQLKGASAAVELSTVNGKVELTAEGGPIKAKTVNGEVIAHIGHASLHENVDVSTVNGNVTVDLPSDLSAAVDLSTVNGSLKSDYDITVSGRIDPHHIKAQLGKAGGPTIKLRTVNGNVELHRS